MEAEPLGQLGERRLGRRAAGGGHEPDDGRLLGEPAVGLELVDRPELPAGRHDRPLEVGRLGVDDPVDVAPEGPRRPGAPRARGSPSRRRSGAGTCRSSRRSSRSRRHGRGGSATTRAGRARRAGPRGPAPRPARRRTRDASGRTARLSEPRARNRPRSQAIRQWSAAAAQSNGAADRSGSATRTCFVRRRRVEQAAGLGRLAAEADRQPGDRGLAGRQRAAEAGRLGRPVAGPLRDDRGELRPERRDEVAIRVGHRPRPAGTASRRSGRPADRAPRRRVAPSRSAMRMIAAARRAGSWWCGSSGSTTSSRTSRGGRLDARRPAQPDRATVAVRAPADRRRRTSGCWRGRRRRSRATVWRSSASTWSARSKPSVSPGWVATLQT